MTMIEVNYDAARQLVTYKPDDLGMEDFPTSNLRFAIAIARRYRFSHFSFNELIVLHKKQFSGVAHHSVMSPPGQPKYLTAKPSELDKYQFSIENWVFQMRRTLDSIVQYASLVSKKDSSQQGLYKIEISGIDDLLKHGGNKNEVFFELLASSSLETADPTSFLKIINDIFNAMKHHWTNEESLQTYCKEYPTVFTYYSKLNDPEKYGVILHNHNCYHLMMGFQDMVRFFLTNIKSFHKNK